MRNSEIQIGAVYEARVSGRLVPVRVVAAHPAGGWEAINLATGRRLRLKSARRLRRAQEEEQ
jgi:hypothetical protein